MTTVILKEKCTDRPPSNSNLTRFSFSRDNILPSIKNSRKGILSFTQEKDFDVWLWISWKCFCDINLRWSFFFFSNLVTFFEAFNFWQNIFTYTNFFFGLWGKWCILFHSRYYVKPHSLLSKSHFKVLIFLKKFRDIKSCFLQDLHPIQSII